MGRRTGPNLAERARPAGTAPDPAIRHCWVEDPVGGLIKHPGLLLEWRHDAADNWQGLVVYVPAGGRHHLVQGWLPAALLTARP